MINLGVCRQLGIISYHPPRQGPKKSGEATVPMVRVFLILQSLKLPPKHCSFVDVKLEGVYSAGQPLLVEPREDVTGITMETAIV